MDTRNHIEEAEEGLYDREERTVRWSRLGFAFALIVAAVVLIILENHFGTVPAAHAPAATPMPSLPSAGTTVTSGSLTILPKYIGRQVMAGGVHAGASHHLVRAAIRVNNNGSSATHIASRSFSVWHAGKRVAVAEPYPGHPDRLTDQSLPKGGVAEGVLMFDVPDRLGALVLVYVSPDSAHGAVARWSLP